MPDKFLFTFGKFYYEKVWLVTVTDFQGKKYHCVFQYPYPSMSLRILFKRNIKNRRSKLDVRSGGLFLLLWSNQATSSKNHTVVSFICFLMLNHKLRRSCITNRTECKLIKHISTRHTVYDKKGKKCQYITWFKRQWSTSNLKIIDTNPEHTCRF